MSDSERENISYKINPKYIYCCGDFEPEHALAHLLINDVIIINEYWWKKEWIEEARKATALGVICNDLFGWGGADAEQICVGELRQLYDLWIDDPVYGSSIWCILKRKRLPQKPVFDSIQEKTKYDLTKLNFEEDLSFEERLKRITK